MPKAGKLEYIATDGAPAALGAYSQGVAKEMPMEKLIFASGQLGIDPATGKLAGEDAASQAAQSMKNLKAVLEAAGSGMDKVLKINIYMTDGNDFQSINKVYAACFEEGHYPARSAVVVAGLPKEGALVEIEAIGYKD